MRVTPEFLSISLLSLPPGREYSVKPLLADSMGDSPGAYFLAFGHYDLVRLSVQPNVMDPILPAIGSAVTSSHGVLVDGLGRPTEAKTFQEWDCGAIAYLRLNPVAVDKMFFEAELSLAKYITRQAKLKGLDAHAFLGIGYYDLILLLGSKDLGAPLEFVTELRRAALIVDEALDTRRLGGRHIATAAPVLVDSHTIPMVSFSLIEAERYASIDGQSTATLDLWCSPAAEEALVDLLAERIDGDAAVLNAYGGPDLRVVWPAPTDNRKVVEAIASLRRGIGDMPPDTIAGIGSTATNFFSVRVREPSPADRGSLPRKAEYELLSTIGFTYEGWSGVNWEAASVVLASCGSSSIIERAHNLLVKLGAYVGNVSTTRPAVDDLRPFVDYLERVLLAYSESASAGKFVSDIEDELASLVGAGEIAIQQRVAETLGLDSGSRWDFREGLLRAVQAASVIPEFIFAALKATRTSRYRWAGFVIFGQGHSTYALDGEILNLPMDLAFAPEKWIDLTHEIWHAHAARLQASASGNKWVSLLEKVEREAVLSGANLTAKQFLEEMYANWADFVYCYDMDVNEYLSSIWSSWLKVPRVHEYPGEYIVRSFLIWLYAREARDRGHLSYLTMDDLQRELGGFLVELEVMFAGRGQGILPLKRQAVEPILLAAERFQRICRDLEDAFYRPKLRERLCRRPYPRLDDHIEVLLGGGVVTRDIVNPLQLLRRLSAHSRETDRPLATSVRVAILLSLSGLYKELRGGRLAEKASG